MFTANSPLLKNGFAFLIGNRNIVKKKKKGNLKGNCLEDNNRILRSFQKYSLHIQEYPAFIYKWWTACQSASCLFSSYISRCWKAVPLSYTSICLIPWLGSPIVCISIPSLFKFIFNWGEISLQYCIGFCCTAMQAIPFLPLLSWWAFRWIAVSCFQRPDLHVCPEYTLRSHLSPLSFPEDNWVVRGYKLLYLYFLYFMKFMS